MQETPTNTDNWPEIEARCRKALPEYIVDFITECRKEAHPEGNLIWILHQIQAHYGYLSEESLNAVAQLLQVPTAEVTGAASFYHFFRMEARGKYVISICLGTACYVKGADRVLDKLKEELGIEVGETTNDGMFTLDASRCLGTCGLAPVMTIAGDVHPQVTPEKVPAILQRYMDQG